MKEQRPAHFVQSNGMGPLPGELAQAELDVLHGVIAAMRFRVRRRQLGAELPLELVTFRVPLEQH